MCRFVGSVPTEVKKAGHKVVIYLMRHSDPDYGSDGPRLLDLEAPIQFEGKLKEEGKNKIKLASCNLATEFGNMPEKSVILASSPRRRAVESSVILERTLVESGISVSRLESKELQKLLTDATLTGELLEEYGKQAEQNKNLTWMDFWINKSGDFKNVESAVDFKERMRDLILYFQNFSQETNSTIVCLTHEEEIKILAKIFGISILIVPNGGTLKMIINPEEMIVEVQGKSGSLSFEQFDMKEGRQ
ncbi:MAG: hypothetical protein KAI71_03965 [Candidatus Pacebacteria bacterium]|nr:hypothetical protein [Candidatus Paceibacterota bacterium]